MKKILVPTDFSDCAEKALRYAAYLAKKTEAEIILLHVCDLLDATTTNIEKIIQEYNEAKIAELTLSLNRLKECVEKDKVVITTALRDGKIVDSILTVAQQYNADLIVMGTLGATGLKTLFFGTKAAAVINKSIIPVIAVPYDYKNAVLKKILIAINNSKQSPEIFEPVFNLARLFDAKIKTLVFTAEDADAAKMMDHSKVLSHVEQRLEKQFPDQIVESVHIHGNDFHQDVHNYVKKRKTDLLVMVTHERTFMQNLFKLSMTHQMAYHISIPLLSLKGVKP